MDEKSIKQITEKVTEILLKKNQDYGGASFDLGLNGNMVHLWDKVSRFRNLVGYDKKEPNFEGIEETLIDIIGYGIIGMHILQDKTDKSKIFGTKG